MPPIIDERARVLILGSFPSAASLAAGQYYAHKQNQFWRIVGAIIGQPLAAMDYADKQAAVKTAGIAIWDVYAACERAGSLDAAIRDAVPNDFARLKKLCEAVLVPAVGSVVSPGTALVIRRICFNGGTAGRFARVLAPLGYETVILPSTSPANAGWSFERKFAAWRGALTFPASQWVQLPMR